MMRPPKKLLKNWTVQRLMEGPSAYPLPSPGKTVPAATEAAAAVSSVGTTTIPIADIKIILYHLLFKGPVGGPFSLSAEAVPTPPGASAPPWYNRSLPNNR